MHYHIEGNYLDGRRLQFAMYTAETAEDAIDKTSGLINVYVTKCVDPGCRFLPEPWATRAGSSRGVSPLRPGDPLPEETIRRLRDA